MPTLRTLNDIFLAIADSPRDRAMLFQDAAGAWQPISALQVYQRVRALAETLRSWGVRKGDRVAILAENRWEWAVADFACLAIGAIDVPIYPNLLTDHIVPLLVDSGSRILFVSTRAQYEKIAPRSAATPLEHIVIMDDDPTATGAESFSSLIASGSPQPTPRDPAFDEATRAIQPSDLATLIYTSGTTGEPKGVLLTHGNIASNINYSLAEFDLGPADSCISFLPLSHITARHLDYALYVKDVLVAYCSSFDKLPQALLAVQPTILVAVPRVFEKVRQVAEQKASESPIKRRLFAWALATGAKHRDEIAAGRTPSSLSWKLANALVYKKLKAGFGGRVRYAIAGGAPLGLDTAHWFASAGIRILEGYGLTETSPVIALNTENANRMGSVGKPLPNVECRIAADGELLVRGPSIFQGYWKNRHGEEETIDAEGWFHTGDIARIDKDGFLYITDRKKELLKTSGGKLIAPQPIENKLKTSVLVGNCALVGDRRKFAAAIILPNFAALEPWARERGIPFDAREQLVVYDEVRAEFQAIVDRVNATLANFETIKRFRLVHEEWAVDSGELTPSMKLRRRVITQKYAREIAEFYADES
ncbi:MAG TPA: long-chain fatty acid--CoA ligase, partial [Acidobacteriaceae bacterium]|nr:long-chain fatty acid--CoA ligase [Acidobacteriaceae bacterium]